MRIFKYFFILIILLTAFSCEENHKLLKIGTNVWPGYEPIYIAREKGYLDKKHIKIVEFGSASQVLRAYRRNLINSAALTLDEVILLKSLGFEPKIVLISDISNGADALVVKPYIKSLKELKGKKIGVENTALGAFFLSRILEFANLTEKDIQIVPLEINEQINAFKSGLIDAVITFEPVKSQLLKIGGKVLFDSSKIRGEIIDVIVVENDYIVKNPEVVENLVNGWFEALKFLKEHNKKALEIVSMREKVPIDKLKISYRDLILPDKSENLEIINKKLKKIIKKLVLIMKQKKLIPKETNFDAQDLIEIKFIKR